MVRHQALLAARAGSSLLPASTTARVVGSSLLLPLSTATTTIRTFARDSHQPPADVMLALRRVSSLRQRCTDIARVLEEAGALPEDLADEREAWQESADGASLVAAEQEAARLRALADDLSSVLRHAEEMAEHGEHKC